MVPDKGIVTIRRNVMLRFRQWTLAVMVAAAAGCGGSQAPASSQPAQSATAPAGLKIALIAKSSTNPVFLSARTGAEAAARELSQKHGVPVEIAWLTPPTEDGQVQAQRIAQAVNEGANAVLISCSDAGKVTGAINDAVARGVPVMTFDSDAARVAALCVLRSGRREDRRRGDGRAREADGREGRDRDSCRQPERAEPAQARRWRETGGGEVPRHQDRRHVLPPETPQDAAAEVVRVQNAYPQIRGWAMIGGWPLFTQTLLTDLNPAKTKIVAVDGLPAELAYVEKGLAPVLLAQPTYLWGYESVNRIFDKVRLKKDVPAIIPMELVRVSKDNLGTWARQLRDWGFTDVPEAYLKLAEIGNAARLLRRGPAAVSRSHGDRDPAGPRSSRADRAQLRRARRSRRRDRQDRRCPDPARRDRGAPTAPDQSRRICRATGRVAGWRRLSRARSVLS
jgi:ribose transport system substrate-binding protein